MSASEVYTLEHYNRYSVPSNELFIIIGFGCADGSKDAMEVFDRCVLPCRFLFALALFGAACSMLLIPASHLPFHAVLAALFGLLSVYLI
jgi:hypothetical protein